MTTEQEWLGNTPKRLPAIDLTVDVDPALLADPEGRALVEQIHRRKELSNAWEYYASIPVDYDPFKATRAVLGIDPAGEGAVLFHVGGRGHGKTARLQAWLEQERTQMQNMETMTRQMWECLPWHEPHQEVRDLVRKSGTTPAPSVIPEVASVRWACVSPTGRSVRSALEAFYAEYTRGMVDGLAGRPYNRKLIAEMDVQAVRRGSGCGGNVR